jgi:hypothetical protein
LEDWEKKYWIQNWWNWYYSIEQYEHPAYVYGIPKKNDILQGRRRPTLYSLLPEGINETQGPEPNVWFLCGTYGPPAEVKSIIKPGFTRLLVPAYNISASIAEFPSKDEKELEKFVALDVDRVTSKLAKLDGCDITDRLERKKSGFTGWFPVTSIPEENIANLEEENIEVISDGWWLFLDNLEVGDHVLIMKGEADNYRSETRYNITMRGPEKGEKKPQKRREKRR